MYVSMYSSPNISGIKTGRMGWENNNKIDLSEIANEVADSIVPARGRVQFQGELCPMGLVN
jgi:hypothetical protein